MDLFLRDIIFSIKMVSFNHLTSMRNANKGSFTLMGTSLSNGLPHFFKFSFIFMNMQMRYLLYRTIR